jgi:FkbM family methyltransferase
MPRIEACLASPRDNAFGMFANAKAGLRRTFPRLWVKYSQWRCGHDEPELTLLPEIVPRARISIDVGANIGLYTQALAKLSREVHAFEPVDELAEILRKIAPGNVTVHQVALSDRSGMAVLSVPSAGGHRTYGLSSIEPRTGSGFVRTNVQTARLDDLEITEVGFVKVDVEGHEMHVLEGARGIISRDHPIFLVECEERHSYGGPAKLFRFFAEMGYHGRFMYNGDMRPVGDFELETHQGEHAIANSNYVNNFFFFP